MSKPIIEVENLSKVYTIGHQHQAQYETLRDNLGRVVRKPLELFTGQRLDKEQLWALKDVNFDLQQGDVVGIIGRNGSGKSTLLKVLSRITEPTAGRAIMRGRVASLLEVGTGFHPELTGRENIFLNGAILGMKKREIERKFDEIVDFSEIERFLDTPVKFYSSGMYVRLAFSIAAHLDPDILIVDEVLAVGDSRFQKKSLGKMNTVAGEGRTVLFVSHNLGTILQLCKKGLLLEQGETQGIQPIRGAVQGYLQERNLGSSARFEPEGKTYVESASVTQSDGRFTLRLVITGGDLLDEVIPSFVLYDESLAPIFSTDARQDPSRIKPLRLKTKRAEVTLEVQEPSLRTGAYTLSLWLGDKRGNLWYRLNCLRFEVPLGKGAQSVSEVGHIIPRVEWQIRED
jgi:lipopolysaccharide transport system ATP-binding protein